MSATLENSITLGNEFLQHKVKRDYSEHKVALIREFLQNSMDAKATEIDFTFDYEDRTLIVKDNGCGMDKDILVNCLFNVGGSHKEKDGAVGGFGAAKLILFFQHEYFKITTARDGVIYNVEGVGSKYSDITETPEPFGENGTEVEIKFLEDWAMEENYYGKPYDTYSSFESEAKQFLEKCEFHGARVTWNRYIMEPTTKGNLIKSLEWCDIYGKPIENGTSNYVKVAIRGIQMFQMYVSEMKQDITVELTKNSLSILTSNRDGLRHSFRKELDALVAEFNIDKESFARLQGKKLVYQGKESSFSSTCLDALTEYNQRIVEQLETKISQANEVDNQAELDSLYERKARFNKEIQDLQAETKETTHDFDTEEEIDFSDEEKIKFFKNMIEKMTVASHISGIVEDEMVEEISENYGDFISKTSFDFVVNIEKNIDAIPAKLNPSKGMIQKYYRIAQLWKHSIDTIARHENIDMDYKICWVLSDETEASYGKKDGVSQFLINPEMEKWFDVKNKAQQVKRIFRTACHEFVHSLNYQYHDERFVLRLEDLLEIQDDIANWKSFEKDAYEKFI